jgi:acyl carrier protein
VRLESLPLTTNGKLDRKALAAPGPDAYAAQTYEQPHGQIEQMVAGIWAEVLQVERVGRLDNFFNLGGHSLSAMRVVNRLRDALDAEIELWVLFSNPILSDLARTLADIEICEESTASGAL